MKPVYRSVGLTLDLRRMELDSPDPARWTAAREAMVALEAGAVANPSEKRQVGHYWLRDDRPDVTAAHAAIRAVDATGFDAFIVCGIGGSALGPQLLAAALPSRGLRPVFLDNTDPVGISDALRTVDPARTLVLVVSKSGETKETRNAMLEVQAVYAEAGVGFDERAIAVSCEGSALWENAATWRARIPIWAWVGGRTSVTSAVGLLPLFLMGHDSSELVAGAAAMDDWTRADDNPALALAEAWWQQRPNAMVMLPYADRLGLFGRYLQQLVMESLGKDGQGLTVYGNKGSTDQHAYVQQLRDGPADFFASFLVAHGGPRGVEVEPGVHTGDYLVGFLIGTRNALTEAGRRSLTLELDGLTPRTLGALIALYERAVGFYATFAGINAYDQPGVEAGKKAAGTALGLLARLRQGETIESDDAELLRTHLETP
ncbi:MAG: glucose-6-phosphate isomerase [Proteobacteria bacterium]|nr:glucose-6-phosphate isomerase [Pseudomonadota bacterium]